MAQPAYGPQAKCTLPLSHLWPGHGVRDLVAQIQSSWEVGMSRTTTNCIYYTPDLSPLRHKYENHFRLQKNLVQIST